MTDNYSTEYRKVPHYSPSTIQAEIPQDPGRCIFLLSKQANKHSKNKHSKKHWRYRHLGKVLGVASFGCVAWLTLGEEIFKTEEEEQFWNIQKYFQNYLFFGHFQSFGLIYKQIYDSQIFEIVIPFTNFQIIIHHKAERLSQNYFKRHCIVWNHNASFSSWTKFLLGGFIEPLSINAHFIGFLWYSHFKNMISSH